MDAMLADARYAVRTLRKAPTFAVVAILTLALGIGASTAVFSVVDAVLLRPLPFEDPGRLVVLWQYTPKLPNLERMFVSYPDFVDWRERNRSFEALAVFRLDDATLTGEREPASIAVGVASAELFSVLGVEPALGRAFEPADDRPGAPRTVLLGHAVWQGMFGGDPSVVGRTITLDGEPTTVLGVLPPGFAFPYVTPNVEMWMPLGLFTDESAFTTRGNHPGLIGVGRLARGVTLEAARNDMEAVAASLARDYPGTNETVTARLLPLDEQLTGDVRPALLVIFAAIGLVLLIACANVANLMLARATVRRRELAVRAALGASRSRIVAQMLVESVVLAAAGAALGSCLAVWFVDALRAVGPEDLPRLANAALDLRALAFTCALALATGIAFGLGPALFGSHLDVNDELKEGGRGLSGSLGRNRLRSVFVAVELALAVTLLFGAGILLKSFARVVDVSPGFDPERVTVAEVTLPSRTYGEPAKRLSFFGELVERARSTPGVDSVALVSAVPMWGGSWQTDVKVEGRPTPAGEIAPLADISVTSGDYFATMKIPLLAGRDFAATDTAGRHAVAIVDDETARRLWPGESPLGERISLTKDDRGELEWREIVGVVGHVKRYGLDVDSRMQVYVPFEQLPVRTMALAVRGSGDPDAIARSMRAAVVAVDPDQPVSRLDTMANVVSASVAQRRFSMLLLSAFAAVALVLAAIGIYGVVAYLVAQRRNEFGIRVALGAQGRDVLALVVRQGLLLAAAGIGIGIVAALAASRLLASMLFDVSPTDPTVLVSVVATLGAVALAASLVPALRASRVDPAAVLRSE